MEEDNWSDHENEAGEEEPLLKEEETFSEIAAERAADDMLDAELSMGTSFFKNLTRAAVVKFILSFEDKNK